MSHLERYTANRGPDGAMGAIGRGVVDEFFNGDRAPFSNESASKIAAYRKELTFEALDGRTVFPPWHETISHRTFRLHFEWPLRPQSDRITVFYLDPKITID